MSNRELSKFIVNSIKNGYELKIYKSGENVIIEQIESRKTIYAICISIKTFEGLNADCIFCN